MTDIEQYGEQLEQTREFLTARFSPFPRIGIIAGTGLGMLGLESESKAILPYESIPHFPLSTVPGHEGRLIWSAIEGRNVLIFQGRCHLYEGYKPQQICFPLRAAIAGGLRGLVVTNAAGGLNPAFSTGDIMLLRDHINMSGANPLLGPHAPGWGPRFPDMSAAYDRELRHLALEVADEARIRLRHGVYLAVSGPSLETPAETRMFRMLGADAIGMSSVPEVTVAVQAGLRVLAFSVISNMNRPDNMQRSCLDSILAAAEAAAPRLSHVVRTVVARWPE